MMSEASTGVVDDVRDRHAPPDRGVDDIAIDPEPLPTMSRVEREHLRRARTARHRRGEAIAAGVALLIGAVAALATSPFHASGAPARPTGRVAVSTAARPHTVLVVHSDRAHHVDLAAVVGVDAAGRNGSFVFVPPPTVVEVPSLELQPIGSLLRIGDRSLLLDVVENTMGAHVDRMAVLDNDTLARSFGAVRSLSIAFPHAVTVSDSGGTLTYPAGSVAGVSPAQAVRLLVGHEAGGTLLHLATAQAVLEGYFDAVRASPSATRRASAVRGATPFTALAAVPNMQYDVIPVTSSDAAGGERFDVREGDLDQLTRRDFGFDRLGGAAARPRVELLNGVGTAGLTQRVARIAIPAGGYVTLTNNVEGFRQSITRIIYYDPGEYATAQRFARLLGAKSVARGAIPLASVDLTVVIGNDFAKKLKGPR